MVAAVLLASSGEATSGYSDQTMLFGWCAPMRSVFVQVGGMARGATGGDGTDVYQFDSVTRRLTRYPDLPLEFLEALGNACTPEPLIALDAKELERLSKSLACTVVGRGEIPNPQLAYLDGAETDEGARAAADAAGIARTVTWENVTCTIAGQPGRRLSTGVFRTFNAPGVRIARGWRLRDAPEVVVVALSHVGYVTVEGAYAGEELAAPLLESTTAAEPPFLAFMQLGAPGAVATARTATGRTALHWAASGGLHGWIDLLVRRGAVVDAQDGAGVTPLMLAAKGGHERFVRQLLARKADPNVVSSDSGTALLLAHRGRHLAVARLLKAAGAGRAEGLLLLAAARDGRVDAALELIVAQGNLDARDENGWTPLRWAASNGDVTLVRALLASGAPATAPGEGAEALVEAAAGGKLEPVRLLLEAGVAVRGTDHGSRALDAAAGYGHEAVVRLLVGAGAKGRWVVSTTAAMLALAPGLAPGQATEATWWAATNGRADILLALLRAGADKDGGDEPPLILAAEGGHLEAVRVLLEARADPDRPGWAGRTALEAASGRGHHQVVSALLGAGARLRDPATPGAPNLLAALVGIPALRADLERYLRQLPAGERDRALREASRHAPVEAIDLLLRCGANVDARDDDGRTALYFAVYYGRADQVRRLIAAGASVNVVARDGCGNQTGLLSLAAWRGEASVERMLIEAGARPDEPCDAGHARPSEQR